jgi:hypothetical protein
MIAMLWAQYGGNVGTICIVPLRGASKHGMFGICLPAVMASQEVTWEALPRMVQADKRLCFCPPAVHSVMMQNNLTVAGRWWTVSVHGGCPWRPFFIFLESVLLWMQVAMKLGEGVVSLSIKGRVQRAHVHLCNITLRKLEDQNASHFSCRQVCNVTKWLLTSLVAMPACGVPFIDMQMACKVLGLLLPQLLESSCLPVCWHCCLYSLVYALSRSRRSQAIQAPCTVAKSRR